MPRWGLPKRAPRQAITRADAGVAGALRVEGHLSPGGWLPPACETRRAFGQVLMD